MPGITDFLKNLVAGKGLVEQIGNVADKFITTEAEREAFKLEIRKVQQQYETEVMRIAQEDRISARQMQQSALAQDDKFSKRFVYFLAAFLMIFGAAYIIAVTFFPVPVANTRFADTMTGVVITMVFSAVVQYFFGSSIGSRDKMDFIKRPEQ
jgi:predicted phage tail protein